MRACEVNDNIYLLLKICHFNQIRCDKTLKFNTNKNLKN